MLVLFQTTNMTERIEETAQRMESLVLSEQQNSTDPAVILLKVFVILSKEEDDCNASNFTGSGTLQVYS